MKTIHPVDRLGAIRAQIADLRKLEEVAERDVKALIAAEVTEGPDGPVVDGDLFRCRSVVQFRESIDPKKVRELCHPNTVKACTRVTEVQSLRVAARSTEKLAVAA